MRYSYSCIESNKHVTMYACHKGLIAAGTWMCPSFPDCAASRLIDEALINEAPISVLSAAPRYSRKISV